MIMINKDTQLYGSFSDNPGNNGCNFFNKGFKKHDRTLRKKLKKEKFKEYLQNPELKLNPKTPSSLAKKIIGNAISAGFIS